MSISQAVITAYESLWGTPDRSARFDKGTDSIEVYKWTANTNGEGVDIYATSGASAASLPGEDIGHRVEYFVGLTPGRDEIASPLAALGLYARREDVAIAHGHTVPAGGALWPGTEMDSFLVLRQKNTIIPSVEAQYGIHIEFLQAVPIYRAEVMYKVVNGVDALLDLWQRSATPFWDSRRSAVRD